MTAPPAGALEACLALLPCPWCGAEMGPATVSEGSTFRWRKVDGCCADGPEVRHNTMADDQAAAEVESTRKAIEAWNTRPALLAALRLRERAERLEAALRLYMAAGVANSTDFRTQARARDAARAALADGEAASR